MYIAKFMAPALVILAAGCDDSGSPTYTLYRSSIVDPTLRIHMATFDADEPGGYNEENCYIAASLFAEQPGVTARYWCERGKFRP